jgi:hypothetical protein
MKKLLLSIVVLLAVVAGAQAQISGGLKAGLNLASLGGDYEDAKMRPSIHVGGYVNIGLTEKLSFQPELLFNSIGAKYKGSENDGNDTYSWEGTTKLSYISLPLNLQYSFGKFNVHLGPQISFLASAKDKWEESGPDGSDSGEDDIKDGLKGIDLGLNIGLGLNFGKVDVSARYTAGLSNIADVDDDADYKVTNNVIQLSVGYRLFGGKD